MRSSRKDGIHCLCRIFNHYLYGKQKNPSGVRMEFNENLTWRVVFLVSYIALQQAWNGLRKGISMKYTILLKVVVSALAASIALTACTAPDTERIKSSVEAESTVGEEPDSISAHPTLGQAADYLMRAAGKYKITAERADVLEGFREEETATWLQLLVVAGRAFGELPALTEAEQRMAPPPVDLSEVPEWAVEALQNLADGGILGPSDLGQEAGADLSAARRTTADLEEPAVMRDMKILASRPHARFKTSLNDDFYHTVNKELFGSLEIPEGELFVGGSSEVAASTDELMPEARPSELFSMIGVKPGTEMQVFDEKQFEALARCFTPENLELFKAYQKMALLTGFSGYLGEEAASEFSYGEYAGGAAANAAVQTFLSEELGEIYVNRYFSPESKAEIENMADRMISVFKNRISRLDWMEESTKQEALRKLDHITVLIGYPDEWQKTEAVIESPADGGSYFSNVAAVSVWQWKQMVEKLENPVEERRFPLAAYTVNAAASRNTNTIIFPAGILQAPFYDPDASFEENLGSIGTTIAHEITHMFDDGGAQYDADGNIRNWWSEKDYTHFKDLCGKAEAFYDGYEAVPGAAVSGAGVLSENIADIGGVACSLEILSEMEHPDYDAFFRSYARQWYVCCAGGPP